jgi:excisionase family DNA binding protein
MALIGASDRKPIMDNSTTIQPLTVGVSEAGKLLGISPHTVRAWIYQGRLKSIHLGGRVMIVYEELRRVAKEGIPPQSRNN